MSRSRGRRTKKKNCWPLLKFIFISPFDIFSISIQWFYKNLFFSSLLAFSQLLSVYCSYSCWACRKKKETAKIIWFHFSYSNFFLFALYFIFFCPSIEYFFFRACFLEWKGIFAGSNDCDDKFVRYVTRSL